MKGTSEDDHWIIDLAELAAAGLMDKANLPSLYVYPIQARRIASIRWPARFVLPPSGPLYGLLATLLLALLESPGMSLSQPDSNQTSNDLLLRLASGLTKAGNCETVVQSLNDIRDIQNAPYASNSRHSWCPLQRLEIGEL